MIKIVFYLLLFTFNFSLIFAQVSGNIVVRPDTDQIPISPYVFGSGDEMTANFSPLSQSQPLIAATKPSLLRFGGIGAEYLDWAADSLAGIQYIDVIDTFILPININFGTDSLLRLCEDVGAEPILTVNMQIADTLLARRMVEYVNGDTTTEMGHLRTLRGHPDPYNVSIWSLGNEPDIAHLAFPTPYNPWTFYRHFEIPFSNWSWRDSSFWSPHDFANLIPLYVTAMENASPISLSFVLSIAGDPSWLRPVISPNINLIDYLDVHYYPTQVYDSNPDTTDYIEWLSKTDTIFPAEDYIQLFKDSLDALGASSIKLVVLEYNAGLMMIPDALWWNYLCGLFIADCIGHWMHQGLEMAGVYCICRGSPGSTDFPYFGVIRGDTISRRMASYVLELYNTYFGDTLVYSFSDHKNSGYGIECWASKRSFDNKYALVVINKSLDTTYAMTMQIKDSIQRIDLSDITNNAPIGAPYNGTTGIEYHGYFSPDSIKQGWSFFAQTFAPASITLFEASPYVGITEVTGLRYPPLAMSTILRKGMTIQMPLGTYKLYSIIGREIARWDETEKLEFHDIPSGVYFLKIQSQKFTKVIIL